MTAICHVNLRASNTTTHLLQLSRHREGLGPVEHPDVVEAKETAAKQISAVWILSIDPPKQTRRYLTMKLEWMGLFMQCSQEDTLCYTDNVSSNLP